MLKTEDCVMPLLSEHSNRQTRPIRALVANVLAILGQHLLVFLAALDLQDMDLHDEIYVEKRVRAYRFIAQIETSDTCAFCVLYYSPLASAFCLFIFILSFILCSPRWC